MEQRPRARRGEGRNPHKPQNGFAIREFRELRRWSTTALAKQIGISQPTLSNIELERRPASEDVLAAIADELNIDVRAIKRDVGKTATKRSEVVTEAVA